MSVWPLLYYCANFIVCIQTFSIRPLVAQVIASSSLMIILKEHIPIIRTGWNKSYEFEFLYYSSITSKFSKGIFQRAFSSPWIWRNSKLRRELWSSLLLKTTCPPALAQALREDLGGPFPRLPGPQLMISFLDCLDLRDQLDQLFLFDCHLKKSFFPFSSIIFIVWKIFSVWPT